MPTYHYRARGVRGKIQEGIVKARNEMNALTFIKQKNLILIKLTEKSDATGALVQGSAFTQMVGRGLKPKDISILSRQLSTLLSSGLPLVTALLAMQNSTGNPILREVLEKIRLDIEGGSSLNAAFGKYNRYFDELYCSVIRAGEQSGTLAEVMLNLTEAIEKSESIKRKIRQAMSYPIVLSVTMLAAILIFGIWVIPSFASVFSKLGADLPMMTQLVFAASNFICGYWYLLLGSSLGIFFLARRLLKIPIVREHWDRMKLKVYIFGPLFLKINMANFCYMVSILIRSGISVIDTFELAEKTTDNVIVAKSIQEIREKVRKGVTIADAMQDEPFFPELVIQMVHVGEESGQVEKLLEKVAQFYDEEADQTISNLTILIEPILLIFIAALVLVMALAIFLPLWGLHGAITH